MRSIMVSLQHRQSLFIISFAAMLFGLVIILNKNNQSVSTSTSIPAEFFKGAVRQAIESFNVNPQRIRSTEFNLLEDSDKMAAASYLCTPESMNSDRLQQDHPCVIDTIRRLYLHPPAARDIPYVLNEPTKVDPSAGQAASISKYLKNQTGGFFIECGALDGEHLSNTLFMERSLNWNGVLIEADQTSFGKLMSRRRKAYALPVCLSLETYPTQVTFKVVYAIGSIQESLVPNKSEAKEGNLITVQCFPIYSILLAIGQTRVDFFSLDVEGHELKILKTIPWHKVDIKTLAVEWDHVGQQPLIDFMGPKGYYVFGQNTVNVGMDLLFAKNESHSNF